MNSAHQPGADHHQLIGASHWLAAFGLLLFVSLLVACGATVEPPTPVYLKVAGSTTMMPLMQDLASAYRERRPWVNIDINGGGSNLGRDMVAARQVELGAVSWQPGDPPNGLQATVIARDGIALIVHPTNPITGLTLIQVHDLFSGRALDWGEVGGPSSPVQVISREDGSGTRAAFEAIVMQEKRVTPLALVMPSSQAVVDYVARDPRSVGYVSMGYVDGEVRAVPVEGLLPTLENVSRGEYHLTRELVVLSRPGASASAKAFLDFALSPTGQAIVARRHGRVR